MLLVVGRRHRWYGAESVDRRALAESRWIVREAGSSTRMLLEAALSDQGLRPNEIEIALSLPSTEAIVDAVRRSECAAFVSSLAAELPLKAGDLWQVPSVTLSRGFFALTYRDRELTFAAQTFLQFIRQRVAEQGTPP